MALSVHIVVAASIVAVVAPCMFDFLPDTRSGCPSITHDARIRIEFTVFTTLSGTLRGSGFGLFLARHEYHAGREYYQTDDPPNQVCGLRCWLRWGGLGRRDFGGLRLRSGFCRLGLDIC